MPLSEAQRKRNALATARAHHPDDHGLIEARYRDLAEAKLAAYIERTVAAAPPLTDEQRDRLAALLRPAPGR